VSCAAGRVGAGAPGGFRRVVGEWPRTCLQSGPKPACKITLGGGVELDLFAVAVFLQNLTAAITRLRRSSGSGAFMGAKPIQSLSA